MVNISQENVTMLYGFHLVMIKNYILDILKYNKLTLIMEQI